VESVGCVVMVTGVVGVSGHADAFLIRRRRRRRRRFGAVCCVAAVGYAT
jgi:hypothetical protein